MDIGRVAKQDSGAATGVWRGHEHGAGRNRKIPGGARAKDVVLGSGARGRAHHAEGFIRAKILGLLQLCVLKEVMMGAVVAGAYGAGAVVAEEFYTRVRAGKFRFGKRTCPT